jgi:hypothetical protein
MVESEVKIDMLYGKHEIKYAGIVDQSKIGSQPIPKRMI